MWTWCCRKICPCCCCCCPFCCHGKDGDLAELLTSAENINSPDLRCYSIRKVASIRASMSQLDIDSSIDLPISNRSNLPPPRGNARERLGVSPAVYWQPTIHRIQPELDTSVESGPSFNSRSRWVRTFHTLRPRHDGDEEFPLEAISDGASGDAATQPPVTASAPNLAGTVPRSRRNIFSASKSSPKLRHSGTLSDVSKVNAQDNPTNWLKSQSMQDITLPEDGVPKRHEPDKRALKYGINTSLYMVSAPRCPNLQKSLEALDAWRTVGDDEWFVEPSYGEVHFSVAYLETCRKLFVHVARVQNLPPKGLCYKYRIAVKVTILPNERLAKISQTNSGISGSGELSADFADEFQFYVKDLAGHVLRISVYDADFMGRYDAIGHALYYLEDVPAGRRAAHRMKLYKQSQPDQHPGSLQVDFQFDKKQDKMTIIVVRAQNLALSPQATHNWRSLDSFSTYVKVAYFCAGKKLKSFRSPRVSNTRNPIYELKAEFILATNYPHEIYFVIQVLLPGLRIRKDPVIGRLTIGPLYHSEDGKETPWGIAQRTDEVISNWYNMYL